MMPSAVRVLGHREAPGDAGGELHARGRGGRHSGFDVVAMQVQHDAPVARPAQLDRVALGDAHGTAPAGELAAGEREVESALGRERERRRGERRGDGEGAAQRWRTWMLPLPSVPFAL